jgi:hypothetical protein
MYRSRFPSAPLLQSSWLRTSALVFELATSRGGLMCPLLAWIVTKLRLPFHSISEQPSQAASVTQLR